MATRTSAAPTMPRALLLIMAVMSPAATVAAAASSGPATSTASSAGRASGSGLSHAAPAAGSSGSAPIAVVTVVVTVDPKNVTHTVNELFNGCHSDSGYTHQPRGLYAQMVLDESFEGFDVGTLRPVCKQIRVLV